MKQFHEIDQIEKIDIRSLLKQEKYLSRLFHEFVAFMTYCDSKICSKISISMQATEQEKFPVVHIKKHSERRRTKIIITMNW